MNCNLTHRISILSDIYVFCLVIFLIDVIDFRFAIEKSPKFLTYNLKILLFIKLKK